MDTVVDSTHNTTTGKGQSLCLGAHIRVVNDDYLGINPDPSLGAAGLLVDPSLPDGQAAKLLHHCHSDDVSLNG
mgnify:CR=1 FL=1